jgi:uncharacterized protein YbcC (UPF0753/DUF2309 family)
MNKKIKITESQLKRLMENKDKQVNEQETLDEIGIGSIEMGLAEKIAPMVVDKLSVLLGHGDPEAMDMGIFTRALQHKVSELLRERKQEPYLDDEIAHSEMPSQITGMYEQKEKIKSEFKRFL